MNFEKYMYIRICYLSSKTVMKQVRIFTILLFLSITYVSGQNNWSFIASVEENIHISDVRPSYNYIDLTVPAANSGARVGAYYTKSNKLSAEISLGVTGIGSPNVFVTKLVPVEIVGHYNILSNNIEKFKFNIDLGVGSALVSNSNSRFGFSEHGNIGASLEFVDALPGGHLIIGTRYSSFIDDYLDQKVVDETPNDGILRFFTAARFDLGESAKKLKSELAAEQAKAMELNSKLLKAESDLAEGEKQNAELSTALSESNEKLKAQDELLTAYKNHDLNSPSYVLFSPNQSDVNDENIAYLGEVLEILRDNPSIKLEIIGRADMQGSEEYNLELSQKRADAVQLWFSDNGIDRNRMSVISKGKSDPVASNKTQEGMALNRSAQIILKL